MIPDLTDQGKNLLLRALTGDRITFTRIEFGNGTAQDIKTATGLMNPLLSADVSKITQDGDYVAVTATFSNKDLSDGFRITEIGVYALDPDDDTKEILYVLGNEDASAADYVPNNTQRVFDMEQSVLVYIGNAQDVTAAINSSLVFASAADLKEHTENTSNPHNVSKVDVDLGNVPNVSTNDQTPTYETASSLQALKSGEKLSTAFGKIKLAVSTLIDHLSNIKNPHKVSAADIGAAESSHLHSTNDINSGILGIARGGTGAGTAKEALSKLGALPAALISEKIHVSDLTSLDPELVRIYESMSNQSSKFVSALIGGTFYEMHIWRATDLYGSAELKGYLQDKGSRRRTFYNGQWDEWELEDPPMYLGDEYRTTERYKGFTVYAKWVYVGQLTTSGSAKNVALNIPKTASILSLSVIATKAEDEDGIIRHYSFPVIDDGQILCNAHIKYDTTDNHLIVMAYSDMTAYTAKAIIKYCK